MITEKHAYCMWSPYMGLTWEIEARRSQCIAHALWNWGMVEGDEPLERVRLTEEEKAAWKTWRAEGYKVVRVVIKEQQG
jgi:hypothetical protein